MVVEEHLFSSQAVAALERASLFWFKITSEGLLCLSLVGKDKRYLV